MRDRGSAEVEKITFRTLKEVLSDWTSWLQFLLFTFTNTSTYSLAFFVPTILTVYFPCLQCRVTGSNNNSQGMGYTGLKASLYSAWPYLVTMGAMWIFAYISDKTRMRTPVICAQSLLLLIGLLRKLPYPFSGIGRLDDALSHPTQLFPQRPVLRRLSGYHRLSMQCPGTAISRVNQSIRIR